MTSYNGLRGSKLAKLRIVAELEEFLGEERPGRSLEQFEEELGRRLQLLQAELTATELARYDVQAPVIVVGGREFRLCLEKEAKRYLTASAPVVVERNLYRPLGGGKAVCPLELRAGIIGDCTPVLARRVSYLMGLMPSSETAQVFTELGVEGPSPSTCDRMPKRIHPVWEAHREEWESALREQETVPTEATVLACSLDGVMVPDKEAQREAKAQRQEARRQGLQLKECGPAGHREVGCGTVTLYAPPAPDDGTEQEPPGPQRLDTIRYARAPEAKKQTLTRQLDAEVASIVSARPDLRLVALADGAEENWRYFDGPMWREAIKIVDLGHGCEHLKAAMVAAHGGKVKARAEYERLRILLRDKEGGVDEVLVALERLDRKLYREGHSRRRKALAKERTYFRNQRERMDYARYRAEGLPIGSGIVEAACKTLATQRMKLSGMSWGDGKQPILTIRSLQQSGRWSAAWRLIASAYQVQVAAVSKGRPQLRLVREAA
jgi:hypothetical protein